MKFNRTELDGANMFGACVLPAAPPFLLSDTACFALRQRRRKERQAFFNSPACAHSCVALSPCGKYRLSLA